MVLMDFIYFLFTSRLVTTRSSMRRSLKMSVTIPPQVICTLPLPPTITANHRVKIHEALGLCVHQPMGGWGSYEQVPDSSICYCYGDGTTSPSLTHTYTHIHAHCCCPFSDLLASYPPVMKVHKWILLKLYCLRWATSYRPVWNSKTDCEESSCRGRCYLGGDSCFRSFFVPIGEIVFPGFFALSQQSVR